MLAIVNFALLGLHIGAILLAIFVGRKAERLGAAILFAGMVATWTTQALLGLEQLPVYMGIDLLAALAFGALALRFPQKLWPGVAGCSTFFAFVFTATRWIDYPLTESAYIIAKNTASVGIVFALILGSVVERWGKPRLDEWDDFAATLAERG